MALLLHFEYLHKCLFNVTWGLYRITFGALLGQRWAESTQRGRFHNPLPRLNIPVKFVDFRPLVFLKTGITYIQTDKIQRKSDPVLSYTRIFSIAYIYRKNFENSAAVRPYVPDLSAKVFGIWNQLGGFPENAYRNFMDPRVHESCVHTTKISSGSIFLSRGGHEYPREVLRRVKVSRTASRVFIRPDIPVILFWRVSVEPVGTRLPWVPGFIAWLPGVPARFRYPGNHGYQFPRYYPWYPRHPRYTPTEFNI